MSEALNATLVLGLMLLWLIASSARADAYETDWCKTFAAETVTVLRITDPDYATADKAAVDLLTSRVWAACLNSDEPPTMAAIGVSFKGVVPAGADRDAERIKACRKAYNSFRESDMTVIRYGSKGKRVPCPK